jgi:2-polyprenyl-3-methyl-5-hydroxy-6-metoxy-1,4-benzoquinol methylase
MSNDVKTWSTPVTAQEFAAKLCVSCGGSRFAPALRCDGFSFVRCADCGLTQQNPQPSEESVAARYGERHGEDYLRYELANEAPFLRLQELALRDIGFGGLRPGRILDVGCATGALLYSLKKQGWETAGVELCGPSAEYARNSRGIDVRTSTLERAGFPDRSFDVVHASHLIEHLNDPRSFVREAKRVLKENGVLLISTPNIDGFQAKLFRDGWRSAIFDHLYLFSKRTLTDMLSREGFVVAKVATWGGLAAGTAPKPVKAIADRLAKRLGVGDVMMVKALQSP